ncbi:MAG: YkgJ family cysteine cluster protein [Chitinophagaceae bacterium]|nr:MAG: YkgJ family cysteine cluster protein [Chitinophagaceae bacterium]
MNRQEMQQVDDIVHRLNDEVAAAVDCTSCGACCRQLMINITTQDAMKMSNHLQMEPAAFKSRFVEEGSSGMMIMNTIPCHFLANNMCTAYDARFTECREFPDLHKPNFKGRLFATLIHYAMCPIIFNVVERLKDEMGFEKDKHATPYQNNLL